MADNENAEEAQAVTALVEQFRRLRNPAADPDAAVRARLADFERRLLKKSEGGIDEPEAQAALAEEIAHAPGRWPEDPARLARLLTEVFDDGTRRLASALSPPAQLACLGIQNVRSMDIVDAAMFRQFPALTPTEDAAAWREATEFMKKEARFKGAIAAAFEAWGNVHTARGRPEKELVYGTFLAECGLLEQKPGGGQVIHLQNIVHISDEDLRRAVVAAAWGAAETDPFKKPLRRQRRPS